MQCATPVLKLTFDMAMLQSVVWVFGCLSGVQINGDRKRQVAGTWRELLDTSLGQPVLYIHYLYCIGAYTKHVAYLHTRPLRRLRCLTPRAPHQLLARLAIRLN